MTTSHTADELTLHEAADELGVHYMTAYRYVRLGMLEASKQGRSWVVTRDDLEAFMAGQAEPSVRGSAPWDERFTHRILAADDAGAWAVVEAALASGMEPAQVYTEIVVPALRRIGEGWVAGEVSIAEEHAATQIAYRVVARLGPRVARRGVRRGTVVLGSTATELHSLPLSIAADLIRSKSFDVVDLGANLPSESFAERVATTDGVVAVGIGVTSPGQDEEIARTIAAIRSVSDAPILLGGRGAVGIAAEAVGADAVAANGVDVADELIALIESG